MRLTALLLALATLLPAASARGAELRSSAEVRAEISRQHRGSRFRLSGQVVLPTVFPRSFFVIETPDGPLTLTDARTNRTFRANVGDTILVTGVITSSGEQDESPSETVALACTIDLLSHGALPLAPSLPISACHRAENTHRRICTRGILTEVIPDDVDRHFVFLILEDKASSLFLICQSTHDKVGDFLRFLGKGITATGYLTPASSRHQSEGNSLMISGIDSFSPDPSAHTDAFDVGELPLDMANDPKALARTGRRKVAGTILTRWQGNKALLQTPSGSVVRVEFAATDCPRIGETVEAVGLPETDRININLIRALWRPARRADAITPKPVRDTTVRAILTNRHGDPRFCTREIGQPFRVQGTVKGVLDVHGGYRRLLIEDEGFTIFIDGDIPADLQEGCRILATGVFIQDSDTWRPGIFLPKIRGMSLITRSEDDIRLLSSPSWWTPARLVTALTVLLVLLVVILIWNASLRIMVVRKSRALLRTETAKLSETLKIDERTRLAVELHDYLAQNLTAISYQITAALNRLSHNTDDTAECLKTADRMLQSSRTDLRRCLWDLKSDALNEPDLAKAIRRTSEPVLGDATLRIRFEVSRARLNDTTAHAVLSICRELVSNAVRHGNAGCIRIAGERKEGMIRFSVSDDGCGFVVADRPGNSGGHFGLSGIAERAKNFNGSLQINSTPGKGTRVVVTLRTNGLNL